MLKGFTFDLLLTDIVMPGMDGIELAKRAAELNAALKIMFITGFAAVALHPASGAPKQAKVLSKPFHLREIVADSGTLVEVKSRTRSGKSIFIARRLVLPGIGAAKIPGFPRRG